RDRNGLKPTRIMRTPANMSIVALDHAGSRAMKYIGIIMTAVIWNSEASTATAIYFNHCPLIKYGVAAKTIAAAKYCLTPFIETRNMPDAMNTNRLMSYSLEYLYKTKAIVRFV